MAYVADLHIHSRYSQACSQELTIPNLAKWSRLKGIDLVGTGDFLHPLWFGEIKKYIKESPTGFHTLLNPGEENREVKFLLTVELSCIYSERGKTHRIHILVFMPSFEGVARVSEQLTKRGINITSDGRPIMGFSSKELCEIVWRVEPRAIIIPAHIWTPWFSLYGSKSGYDFFKECFGEFSDKLLAVETGLSSEPAMNWRISDLDRKAIVSFSDAHSLHRLGREVTIFNGNLSYDEFRDDLIHQNLTGTIEFFPEEGKYHYSGHRKCGIVYDSEELQKNGPICPVCKKELTIGVLNRVEELATRTVESLKLKKENGIITSTTFPNRPGFRMLVQLDQIIAEALNVVSTSGLKVKQLYDNLVTNVDSELMILTKTSLDKIQIVAGARVAEGVRRVREGQLSITPGYDNTYGEVHIWGEEEEQKVEQVKLF